MYSSNNMVINNHPIIAVLTLWILGWGMAQAVELCDPKLSHLVSAQGQVEVARSPADAWETVTPEQGYCGDDKLRTGDLSRAVLSMDQDATLLALDQQTLLSFMKNADRTVLAVEKGQVHIRSHTPTRFDVTTPFVNAGIEGTEFLVSAKDTIVDISVLEGRVRVFNQYGEIFIRKGQTAQSEPDKAPVLKQIDIRPNDAIRWALYYPPIIDFSAVAHQTKEDSLQKVFEHYQNGDIVSALHVLEHSNRSEDGQILKAGLLLTVGRVDQAEEVLDGAQKGVTNQAVTNALRSVIALSRNNKDEAWQLAQQALSIDSEAPTAYVALSYVQQAQFELKAAQQSVQRALQRAPQSALLHCRNAELLASLNETEAAKVEAKSALSLNPRLGRTYAVLGFIQLTEIDIANAEQSFQQAMQLDSADPLGYFGMALAKIRLNQLPVGKQLLEKAASLSPNDALIRSYLGKVYYELGQSKIAELQFDLSKEADPKDPTAYFYEAIFLQSQNRPVEAIHELEQAIKLNDNRAVNRSRQLLDSDLAARGSALGRIYNEAGMSPRALVHAWKALADDPGDYTAHRLLADTFNAVPGSNLARSSEILQSQLLQPVNITPIQPRLSESSQLLAGNLGPSTLSFNEFNPLFERNRSLSLLSGLVGGNDTYSNEMIHSGVWNQLSYSFGQYHHQSSGYRNNDASEANFYQGFVQASLTPKFNLQLEYKYKEMQSGDKLYSFFPIDKEFQIANEHLTQLLTKNNYRLGFNWAPAEKSRILGSVIHYDRDARREYSRYRLNGSSIAPESIPLHSSGNLGEMQYQFTNENFKTLFGGATSDIQLRSADSLSENKQMGGYIYNYFKFPEHWQWTVAASVNDLQERSETSNGKRTFNPKLGLMWHMTPATVFRAAAFKHTANFAFADQTLEPTHIAGFNQFFMDINQSESIRYGVGLDHEFSEPFKGGIEYSQRRIEVPEGDVESIWKQNQYRGYGIWLPHECCIVGVDYYRERYDGWNDTLTQYIPLSFNYFHPSGWYGKLKATHYWQSAREGWQEGEDTAEFIDLTLGYRLPNRRGIIEFMMQNLLDQSYRFESSSNLGLVPENDAAMNALPFAPQLTVFGRLTLAF